MYSSSLSNSNNYFQRGNMPMQNKRRLGVLLGDVISSRALDRRDVFSQKVQAICDSVNQEFGDRLFAEFKILKGLDEIGGVLYGPAPVYKIISLIAEELHPVSMNFTFVYNYVDTALKTRDTAMMDGPAFHIAAAEMSELKKSQLTFYMACQDDLIDSAITGEVNLLLMIKKHWSSKQHRIVEQYKKVKSQKEVAARLNITQQAVSQALRSVRWKEIDAIEQEINGNLEQYEKMISQ